MYRWRWGENLLVAFLATSWKKLDKHQKVGGRGVGWGNACQGTMSNESMAILITMIHKAQCTSTQRGYGIWWYELGCGKAKWKASMIHIDAIHA